jgi:hypothetical protein
MAAEEMAHEIARFPQACVRADRRSAYLQQGLTVRAALEQEWVNSIGVVELEGAAGAARFAEGAWAAWRFWKDLMCRRPVGIDGWCAEEV